MTASTAPHRVVSVLGFLGGALALALLVLAVVSGGSQSMFQVNRPAADYAALLLRRATILRADLGIDYLFIAVYTGVFVYLARTLDAWAGTATRRHGIWLGALLLTALLDAVENAHILAMLSMATQGLLIPQADIAGQMAASQVKFVASYVGLFLLSFELPAETILERILVAWLRWVQLPVGVGIFVLPPEWVVPLVLLRVVSFVGGLWMIAWVVRARARMRETR